MEVAMNAYQIGAALTAAAASLLFAGAAQADPTGAPSALLCRTEAGVESLYAFHGAHPEASLADGVAAVDAADPSAGCAIVSLIYEVGEIVATVRVNGNGLDVRKVSVLAQCSDARCDDPPAKVGYSVFPLTPTT
jgi:hypothetical protein